MKQTMNPVGWFEIYVDDINRARKFYETVLGKTMEEMPSPNIEGHQMIVFPWVENAPNATGALVKMPGMKPGGNSVLIYFSCEDCQVEQNRVEAAGGKIMEPKFSIGEYGFCAWCIDTEGNCFGLHSMK